MFSQTMWTLRLMSVLAVLATVPVNGYPSGAPFRACRDMFPEGHQVDSRMDEPPFTINVSSNVYLPNDKFRVTVNSSSGYFMSGLFIQARRADCDHPFQSQPIGVFRMHPQEKYLKVMMCQSLNDSLTHKSNSPLHHAVFDWNAPSVPMGHLYLVATVVKQKQTFWTRVYSVIISDLNSPVPVESVKPCDARVFLDPTGRRTTPPVTHFKSTTSRIRRTTSNFKSAGSKMAASLSLLTAILVFCFYQWL